MKEGIIYTHILIESLKKKKTALEQIYKFTQSQEDVLSKENFDEEAFETLIEKKQEYIDIINKLDEGFEITFERVKEELKEQREMFRNEIAELQQLIRQVTDVSTQIQVLEQRNKTAFEKSMYQKREKIKVARLSSQSVSKYYQNTANAHIGESVFLDKKK